MSQTYDQVWACNLELLYKAMVTHVLMREYRYQYPEQVICGLIAPSEIRTTSEQWTRALLTMCPLFGGSIEIYFSCTFALACVMHMYAQMTLFQQGQLTLSLAEFYTQRMRYLLSRLEI